MTDHDQLFKNLFQVFFGDLVRIVAPGLAEKLRVEEPTFLESELFTGLSDRQRVLLVNCIETYVEWNDAAQREYEALLAEEGNEEVATMEMTWADALRAEGLEKGLEKGLEQGLERGREEGRRELLLEQIERRFGPLPAATVKRVRALSFPEELSRLAARVLDASSLEDLGL